MATRQSIFEIQSDFRELREAILTAEGVCSDEQFNTLQAIKMTAEEKLVQCYFILQQWDAEIQVAKDAEAVAYNHRKRREAAQAAMKKRMVEMALELGLRKMDNPHCRFNIQDGKTTLKIIDVDLLPMDLVTTIVTQVEEVKVNIEEVGRRLNNKEAVPGAEYQTGDAFIKFLKAKGE